jgi:hypothetical protein
MKHLKLLATVAVILSIGAGSSACRKRPAAPDSSAPTGATTAAPGTTPAPAQAPTATSVPALSARDEAEIRKRYMPSATPWAKRTAAEKQSAYFGWCQVYMLGDAATKAKVVAEIKQAGLSAEDTEALKKLYRDMRIPMMPL